MNGVLSGMPQGVLMQEGINPRDAMLMQMGLGLLANSGPSMTPTSFGSNFGKAGMQGVAAYQQALQAQQAAALQQQQAARIEEELRLRKEEAARRANTPAAYGPGTQLFRPGENSPFYTVPFKQDPVQPPRPPMSRTIQRGTEKVTQEFVDGKWVDVAAGPAFAKTVETPATAPARPKPPTGFQWNAEGSALEPIPGGPKDTSAKDAARAQGAIQKADTVIGKVDEALKQVGFTSTGLTGTVLGMVPGTKAYDLDKTVDTIKANLGFSELQAMREASPTGGALGQVAIQELAMLQSTVASLDKGQSQENLVRALQQVKTHFSNWKKAVMEAQQGQQAPAAPAAPKRRVYNPKTGKFE